MYNAAIGADGASGQPDRRDAVARSSAAGPGFGPAAPFLFGAVWHCSRGNARFPGRAGPRAEKSHEPDRYRVRTPVRRQGADTFLLITLLSFAASVAVTRLFLTLTGYPQIGGGGIHIAHVLWGGLLLFVAALLPLIFANRWVYTVGAVLAGAGSVCSLMRSASSSPRANDYFYPGAAPIIYAFFLLTVLLYLQIRRPPSLDPRAELYRALEGLEEVLDRDSRPMSRPSWRPT